MKNKYKSIKTSYNGIVFDSKKEAVRYSELLLMERGGIISDLRRQVKYILIPAQYEPSTEVYKKGIHKGEPKRGKLLEKECSYIADFVYYDKEKGVEVVEDTKGFRTKEYVIKRKLMLLVHGIRIKEI